MELVDGKPLHGPVPISEALQLAKQIAEALEAAHEKGIIHRDLKPGNILVTPDGVVKVLDFGLAKAIERPTEISPNSPTLSMRATEAGLILGTAGYMSPEQAAGKPVDRRADIWSFGVVLHELLTGRRLFDGETVSHTLADVLKGEIDTSDIPQGPIRDLIRRCLDRNLKTRLQHIGEARIAIENYIANPWKPAPPQNTHRPWALIATAMLTTAIAAWALLRPVQQPVQPTVRFSSPGAEASRSGQGVAISRDGQYLAYTQPSGDNRASSIMLRRMDQFEAQPVAGTEGAARPHFSPDGRWIVYSVGNQTRNISINGGASISVTNESTGLGRTWAPDNALIFGGTPLRRLRSDNGKPEAITKLEAGETTHRWPYFLPGGESLVFNVIRTLDSNDATIEVLALKSGTRRPLLLKGGSPRYVPTGHLVYVRNTTLFAVPFDPKSLSPTGPEVPVVQNLFHNSSGGYADYSFSETGHLVYASESRAAARALEWADRAGAAQPLPGAPRVYAAVSLSPSGNRIAAEVGAGFSNSDIWIQDLERGINTRLTTEGTFSSPAWTPDGRRVVYGSIAGEILAAPSEGGAKPEILFPPVLAGRIRQTPDSWSPDGGTLFFERREGSISSIWAGSVPGPSKPQRLVDARGSQYGARVAPDGKAFAYISSESGADELYIQTYPAPGQRVQISANGATRAFWFPDGKHIYYKNGSTGPLMAASIQITGTQIRAGVPQKLFDFDGSFAGVTPDGKRFLMIKSASADADSPKINIVLNWFDELRRLSPVTGAPPPPRPY